MSLFQNRYFKKLLILTIILFAISILVQYIAPSIIHKTYPFMILIVAFITFFVLKILENSLKKSQQTFMRNFMILTFSKSFLLLLIIGIYIFIVKENIKVFAFNFIIYYFAFLFFEIYWLVNINKSYK